MARTRLSRDTLPPRLLALFIGMGIGAAWGAVMWVIASLTGTDSGVSGLFYLMITTAMIGGGAAALFGAFGARRRGEKVHPKLPYRRPGKS